MNLSSKILYCRKKAGLSQEALAEVIGVVMMIAGIVLAIYLKKRANDGEK